MGIDRVDQATADRFVTELDTRGLIPDEIKAELEEAARLEQIAARSRETHERAAWCALSIEMNDRSRAQFADTTRTQNAADTKWTVAII